MADREKIEKGLRICTSKEPCNGCPYLNERNCSLSMVADALALLKEQEAVVHCGECENFCFDNISPNAGRCMLTYKSHSKRLWKTRLCNRNRRNVRCRRTNKKSKGIIVEIE